jgi:hypothetical protein
MKKIPSLFKRNYETDRLVRDEVVEGCEWVLAGEGVPTEKFDGTACLIRGCKLYRRYDRKLTNPAHRRRKAGHKGPWSIEDFRGAPAGWEPCEPEHDPLSAHWPGWHPVGDEPGSKWHRAGLENLVGVAQSVRGERAGVIDDGTYELVGPKVQSNPYQLKEHQLWRHGGISYRSAGLTALVPSFRTIRLCLEELLIEGIVWHHPDGRMAKVKRRDFGLPWPVRPA